jgi:small subunit ribosomal protein S13
MIFFLNTNLNENKKVFVALTKIYGLGNHHSSQICDELGISREKTLSQLTSLELEKLTNIITYNYEIGIDIKRSTLYNIQRLIKIGTYRGFRHVDGLPVRGQKTHGNSQTARKFKMNLHKIKK